MLLSLILVTTLSARVAAHELPVERQMVVQRSGQILSIMVVFREPPGKRVDRLIAFYDLDQDGRLNSSEVRALGPELSKRALHEIKIQSPSAVLVAKTSEIKVINERKGVVAAVFLEFDIAGLSGFSVQLGSSSGVIPLALNMLPSTGGEPLSGPSSVVLSAGQSCHFDLRASHGNQ